VKRSTTVSLVLLGAAGLTIYALNRSEGDTEVSPFRSVDECRNSGRDAKACQDSYDDALRLHETNAPRFESQNDCERDYGVGKCTTKQALSSSGSMASYFVPALAGFAIAKALSNQQGRLAAQPLYSCPSYRQQPDGTCYNTSTGRSFFSYFGSGSSSSSGSSWWSSRSSSAYVPSDSFARASSPAVVSRGSSVSSVSRGGFGSTGHSYSSSSS
jgi:uncharacterized protein YgiB involved in biofilm formation